MRKGVGLIFTVFLIWVVTCISPCLVRGSAFFAVAVRDEFLELPQPLLTIISVDMDKVPLEKALSLIARKGDFKLNYNRNRIPVDKEVSVTMNRVPAVKVLQRILDKTGTELMVTRGGQFAVIPKKRRNNGCGTIVGRVSEGMSNRNIPGVLIKLTPAIFSTLSDEKGEFKLTNVPAGRYTLTFSAAGFKRVVKKDVEVDSKGVSPVNVSMDEQRLHLEERVEVLRNYFHVDERNPVSMISVSSEEARRAPGTAGCISRMLRTMPGITSMSDATSELVIRGGSPLENGFYIDNIEVPGISHLPALGSNGGIYSALHPDLIRNIELHSGGFSSNYGDHLSSVTEIAFREGNREEFKGEFSVSTTMGSGVLEGPLVKGKSALLIAFRKSWLDWLRDYVGDLDEVPETFDSQIKLTFDITPEHKVNFLHFHGSGTFSDGIYDAWVLEEGQCTQNTSGINWLSNWSENFFSNTSLSYSSLKRGGEETAVGYLGRNKRWEIDDFARFFSLRHSNFLIFDNQDKLEFGFQVKHETAKSGYLIYNYTDEAKNILPGKKENSRFQRTGCSLFFSYTRNPFKGLISTIGLRVDYSFGPNVIHFSPRFSMAYQIDNNLSLNGGFGVFYQPLPMNYLAYTPGIANLKDMKAIHYILGLEYFPASGTKISLEAYNKVYNNLPINPDFPYALFSDWLLDRSVDNIYSPTAYFTQTPLSDKGSGYSRGIELLIQKKLIDKFYGIFSASIFRSRYKDLSGVVRDRIYDNRYVINLAAVYKPGKKWEISAKCTFMGGAPYTPIDIERSVASLAWTLDQSKFHSRRYPEYRSLNLRVNRRFNLGKTGLLVYIEAINVFDKENVSSYYWQGSRWGYHMGTEDQLPFLPIIGIQYEF